MISPKPLRVLIIVGDEPIMADALKRMLKNMGHDCIELKGYKAGKELVLTKAFDLAILDLPPKNILAGIELGRACSLAEKPFFFLTSVLDFETLVLVKSVKPGAFVVKPFTEQDLLVAVEMTLMHQQTDPENKLEKKIKSLGLSLSQRETEVLKCLINHKSNTQVAEILFISPNTVKFHIKNLYTKLGITGRSELYAIFEYK